MRPIYVMLIGLPASGKSTLAKMIVEAFPRFHWHVASTDSYIEAEAERLGKTYNEVFNATIKEAHRSLDSGLALAFKGNYDIIHDQTNLTIKSRAKKLALVPANYVKVGLLCEVDPDIRRKRLDNRPGKTIPNDVDTKMAASFERADVGEFDWSRMAKDWREVLTPIMQERTSHGVW